MNINLKSLHLENFKGIKLLDVSFGKKTRIKGQNASGKTTVFDAFTFLLFNKNSAGEEKFQVRPLDADGNRIDNVEIKVVAVLDVDGKEVELSKVQKQNWVKHRNSPAPTLEGNVNSFEIDGYPKSEADYKAYINELVNEDLFKMITNPQYFSGMKWKDQRDILMKFVSDMPDAAMARQMQDEVGSDQFGLLIPELEKAPSTDDIQKKFSKALSEWKKKQAEIPVRIDELSKSIVEIDVAEQELAKQNLERKIAEIDAKKSNAGSAVSDLMNEEMQLQFDLSGIMQTMNRELSDRRNKLDTTIMDNKKQIDYCKSGIETKEKSIADNKLAIEAAEKKRSELGNAYKTETAKAFDSTPFQFHEEEWQFDENSTVCKSCGQTLPADRIEQIRADFEERKVKAKEDVSRTLGEARAKFEKQRNDNLERIKADGFTQKDIIEDLRSKNESLQKDIDSLKRALSEANEKAGKLLQEYDDLPEEVDYSQNEEYVKLKARHDEVTGQIEAMRNTADASEAFKEERKALVAELDAVKAEIAKASKNVEIEERIGQLQEEQREVGQKVADQEQMLFLLESFIKAKMERISDSINQHFKTVNFKLFETQLNGGLKECCECTVNGVPYSTLNSGHRIVAGLDIIQSLSELYGVTAPIFVDNAESLNEYNVPDMEAQMVLLAVSDDKELKVEVE